MQDSHLPQIIESWSDPTGLFSWNANFAIRLMRSHRIHESLLLVLFDWIPKAISGHWHKEVVTVIFNVIIS